MRGFPPSSVSSSDRRARSPRIVSAASCSSLARSSAGTRRQCVWAAAAAAHARATSSALASATSSTIASVAGF